MPTPMPEVLPERDMDMVKDESPMLPMTPMTPIAPATPPPPMPRFATEGWQMLESPDIDADEIPLMESVYCPPEDGYVPQAVSPIMQPEQWGPLMPMPHHHHHGCGQGHGCGCGCGGGHQMPMVSPIHVMHPCGCHMMAHPYGYNWHGNH